jgi:hypothetical protein
LKDLGERQQTRLAATLSHSPFCEPLRFFQTVRT